MEAHLMLLAAAGDDTSGKYWILIALAMLIASYLLMRPKKRKDPLNRPPSSSLSQERGIERQMQGLLVELTQMAQQISAQLDTRSAKLEALIREADEKIRQLSVLRNPDAAATIERAPEKQDQRYMEIYAMADKGAAVTEIAQKLDRPAGEIELILALRPSRSK
jgi:hypothetical protein